MTTSSVADQVLVSQRPLPIYGQPEGTKTQSEWMRLLGGAELPSAVRIQFVYLLHLLTDNVVFDQGRICIVLAGELKKEDSQRDATADGLVRT